MLSDDQESCTSQNSQNFGQATSTTSISPQGPQPLSITAGDIAPGQIAINMLLDEVLLEIFACYVEESQSRDAWHTLACVCRRWRSIAFGSPRRLNLRIFCTERKSLIPVRKNLDFWPPFPIVLTVDYLRNLGEDNILATLEQHDRVCHIEIWNNSSSLWEKVLPLMQKPFPILTDLNLRYTDGMASSVIPDSFLGGSAPRLRKLNLQGIPFPGLPNLLLSATDLVHLELYEIPDSGYISPDAMVTCISTSTRLELLKLSFESPRPRPEWERRRTSSSTRALLPSLTRFTFNGVSEYLEDIVDKIDAPLLDRLRIRFFHQPIFDTPRLAQFISRVPKLKTCNEARLRLGSWHAFVKVLSLSISKTTTNASLLLEDWHAQQDFQLSPLVQFCTSSLPQALIPTVEGLVIVGSNFSRPPGQDGIDPSLWRELLQPFTAVKDLYLSREVVPRIALVL
jgi:F-box-like